MMIDLWKSDSDWFRHWFNTDAYHSLYQKRDNQEAEKFVERISNVILSEPNQCILDLGCGIGRHAAHLAKMGHDVKGMDLSENSIRTARLNNDNKERLHFEVGDMRTLQRLFNENEFTAVVSMFTSMGYFEKDQDVEDTFQGIDYVLGEKGIFVLDFLNVPWVESKLVAEEKIEREDYSFLVHRRIAGGWIEKSVQYVDSEGRLQHFVERVRAWDFEDWERHFKSLGWQTIHRFGDYALKPLTMNSPRCILVAQKKTCG